MSNIQKPVWKYQYSSPSAGRKLYLLTPGELVTAAPIIKKTIKLRFNSEYEKHKLFRNMTFEEHSNKALELQRSLREFEKLLENGTYEHEVNNEIDLELHIVTVINMFCNQIFSDNGWKYIRKLIAQAVKRTKNNMIVLDLDTHKQLMEYAKVYNIKTPSEAVSQLLVDIKEIDKKFLIEKLD